MPTSAVAYPVFLGSELRWSMTFDGKHRWNLSTNRLLFSVVIPNRSLVQRVEHVGISGTTAGVDSLGERGIHFLPLGQRAPGAQENILDLGIRRALHRNEPYHHLLIREEYAARGSERVGLLPPRIGGAFASGRHSGAEDSSGSTLKATFHV